MTNSGSKDELSAAKQLCLKYLTYRAYSKQELYKKLCQKGIIPEIIEFTLENLQNLKLIDDENLAALLIKDRIQRGNMGRKRIMLDLLKRGIDKELAEKILEREMVLSEDDSCHNLAQRKLKNYTGLPKLTIRRRLSAFLIRRGFDNELVYQTINNLLPPEN